MKKNNVFLMTLMAFLLSMAMVFTACNDDDDDPLPLEALITEFAITNAGADGETVVEGVITDFSILVVVAFETDVTALIPEIKVSPGASVIPASGTELDFTQPRNFVVTHGDISNTYQVTVEKADPTEGVIMDITIISATSEEEYDTQIDQIGKSILVTYNNLQSPTAVIKEIDLFPAGSIYNTSSGTDTLDLTTDETITVVFAGAETVYTIETNVTEAGFNPDNTQVLLDRSAASGLMPSVISNETNRGSDFDGQYVYVVSRQEGHHIYYWDVENPSADPGTLVLGDAVSGGTWLVSDVRYKNGNIYASNMVMDPQQVFKVYRWDDKDDENPELILEYTIPDEGIRLGDAISIIGNPPANGYIYASNFAWPNQASEFYVFDFNGSKAGDPVVIPINPLEGLRIGQYGRVNAIPGVDDLLLVTGAEMGVAVMDLDGNILAETAEPMVQTRSYDPRVWEYNGGRYLSFTVNREWEGQGAYFQVLNITDGADIVEAIKNITIHTIENIRVYHHVFGAAASNFVGGTHGFAFGDNGKPRVMAFTVHNGFIVKEFSN
ncbi:MAG: DUF4623 domain-containing protein [Bacteroidales bacterium]|nr:DUF4623 domain-containing protein [Bacteroidales bacterium]